MTSKKFSTWRQTKGDDPGLLFSSLLRLQMTFSHSTLGAAFLNDEEAHELKKMATGEVCVFSGGKTAENGWWFCCRSAKHFHIVLCV